MKMAGFDAIAVKGKAENPVWINIIDDQVTIEDGASLWGLSTWEAQQEVWRLVGGHMRYGEGWMAAGDAYTTRRPSVVCCGQAGETMSRVSTLVHGAGSGVGQGGYGAVFGSKNLKAISVVGTGSVPVDDPAAVLATRKWFEEEWPLAGTGGQGKPGANGQSNGVNGCMGCSRQCRPRSAAAGTESNCQAAYWFNHPTSPRGTGPTAADRGVASDILQKYGINAFDTSFGGAFCMPIPGNEFLPAVPDGGGLGWYIKWCYDQGYIGPGTDYDTAPLPMESWNSIEFAEPYAKAIATREGFGALIADGAIRFAENIGRLEDLNTVLRFPAWGYVFHWTLPSVEWAYGSLMSGRDINAHDFHDELGPGSAWSPKPWNAQQVVDIFQEKTIPYTGDPFMFDYSWQGPQAYETGIYSSHKAKQIAFHRHYGSFWKESALYCDEVLASWMNSSREDYKGSTPDAEPAFYNAATGLNITFAEGMEIGRKIWNLKRAIRVLQGRHRDQEVFSGFMYKPGASHMNIGGGMPLWDGTEWKHDGMMDMYLSEAGVETWKSHFYILEGWDNYTGWPTRATLTDLGLGDVADVLAAKGKLGGE